MDNNRISTMDCMPGRYKGGETAPNRLRASGPHSRQKSRKISQAGDRGNSSQFRR